MHIRNNPFACKMHNFAKFFSAFKHLKQHEMLNQFSYSLLACRHNYNDKLSPRSLTSGLSALESGGQYFEEGLHLCFTYLKKENLLCGMKAIE